MLEYFEICLNWQGFAGIGLDRLELACIGWNRWEWAGKVLNNLK